MKNITNTIIAVCFCCLVLPKFGAAQCSSGEVEVTLEITTDAYGYESYWEIVPGGNGCGAGTIESGGNTAQLGCNSGGLPATGTQGNGYGNAQTYTVEFCIAEGSDLSIYHIDDYGDGGLSFAVYVDGFFVEDFAGTGNGNTFNFSADLPAAYDFNASDLQRPFPYMQPGDILVKCGFVNAGTTTVNDVVLNYQVDNQPVQSAPISGIIVTNNEWVTIEHPTAWSPSIGTYEVKVWASALNGNADMNNVNDTLRRTVQIGPGMTNIIDSYVGLSSYQQEEMGSSSDGLDKPTDLDFHPFLSRKELWVVNKKTEGNGGSSTTFSNAGESNQSSVTKEDGNNWHFMSLPTGIAFGENQNFGTSAGVYDANHDGGTPFTGPTLWSSDPAIYAQPSGGNGSHLDMLHESPRSQGIAHEKDNVYWVFDGNGFDIVRYDFAADHGPGNDYHSDAIVKRYSDNQVIRDPNDKIVSHLVLDKQSGWLYVVDHGNQRVFRIDITSGSQGNAASYVGGEPLAQYYHMTGYTQENVVVSGLEKPAGIDIIDNRMLVTDYQTSDIIIYDISTMPAVELGRINTGAMGIMGVKIGPDGKIWYVDYDANKLYRVGGEGVGVEETQILSASLYPNPSNGRNVIVSTPELGNMNLELLDVTGRTVYTTQFSQRTELNLDLNNGVYLVRISEPKTGKVSEQRLVITN
ncbi:MAG: T9SS type A sorting domain-containing protein [Flavobacteriales bacterium]